MIIFIGFGDLIPEGYENRILRRGYDKSSSH
jgi:hypothetical protein